MRSSRSIIIILAALAIALSPACSVNTASVDGVDTVPSESGDSPLFQPGLEGEDGIEVEVEDSGDVYVGGDEGDGDVAAQTAEGPVEITTDPATLLSVGSFEEFYEEEVRASGGSEDAYDWSAEGLPLGLGLVPVFGGKRVLIQGELQEVGTHEITITAADPNDLSNKDSITYQLNVEPLTDESGPDEDAPADSNELKIEVLEVGNHNINNRRADKIIVGGSGIGLSEWVKLRITGGRGPYTWMVKSEVEDSFHKINEGSGHYGGNPSIHQMKGITNFKYRNPDGPCLTPEEAADIYTRGEKDSFWPDCSKWYLLTYDQRDLCEKIGCSQDDWPSGPYGSDEYELAQQCVNGFECPSNLYSHFLTDGQQEACQEYEQWKLQKKQQEKHYGKPEYVCKWTKNPTWRIEGMPVPNPPQDNSFGPQADDNPPRTVFVTNDAVNTFVAEMEYDGPLPVDRTKNKVDGKDDLNFLPVEKVIFLVRDTSALPQIASVEVDFSLIYPNERVEEIKTKLLYRDLNVDWNCNDSCKLKLVLLREKPEDDADWSDYENDALAISVFDLKELEQDNPECILNVLDDENPLCTESMDITALTENVITDVGHIALHIYTGYHQETHSSADRADWHYGDMNIEDVSFKSRYYYVQYDDDDAGDLMNKDVSKGDRGMYDLSDTDGIDKANSYGGSFHRRALIPGKWTY